MMLAVSSIMLVDDVGAKAVGPSPRVGVSEGRRAEAQTKKGIKEEHNHKYSAARRKSK